MTTLERKSRVKPMFAGEDIASILGEEEAEAKKSFKTQKQKNSELLTAYREKMRSSEASNELDTNGRSQEEDITQKRDTPYARTNKTNRFEKKPKSYMKSDKQRYNNKKKSYMTRKRYPREPSTRRPSHT